jgi:hypothetical protein
VKLLIIPENSLEGGQIIDLRERWQNRLKVSAVSDAEDS